MGILAYLWRRRFGPDGPAYHGWRRRYLRYYDLDDGGCWCPSLAGVIVDGVCGFAHDLRHLHFRHDHRRCSCLGCGHAAFCHRRRLWHWALRRLDREVRLWPYLGCNGGHDSGVPECHYFRCERRTRRKWHWSFEAGIPSGPRYPFELEPALSRR